MHAHRLMKRYFKLLKYNFFYIDRELICELDLSHDLKPVKTEIPLGCGWGAAKEILSMDKETYEYDKKGKKYVLKRLREGDELLLVFHDGRTVGYHLIMKGMMELTTSIFLKLPPNKVYLYKGFVKKSYRGKRIIDYLIYVTADQLKREGFTKLIIAVSVKNSPMLRVVDKLGFDILGTIYLFKILGFNLPFVPKRTLRILKCL